MRGGCLCGAVRFELTAPPVSASYCHCTRCQRRTGTAASAQASIEPGSLRLVQGEEHVGAWEPADGWAKLFCRLCGAALFSRHPTDRDVFSVRMGAFDGDPGVRPSYRQYVRSPAGFAQVHLDADAWPVAVDLIQAGPLSGDATARRLALVPEAPPDPPPAAYPAAVRRR